MKSKIDWSNVAVFIVMILTIAVGSLVISWMLQDTERSRNMEQCSRFHSDDFNNCCGVSGYFLDVARH
nr:MAG TPA: hypothetical protein [Bacteriophage sp.]